MSRHRQLFDGLSSAADGSARAFGERLLRRPAIPTISVDEDGQGQSNSHSEMPEPLIRCEHLQPLEQVPGTAHRQPVFNKGVRIVRHDRGRLPSRLRRRRLRRTHVRRDPRIQIPRRIERLVAELGEGRPAADASQFCKRIGRPSNPVALGQVPRRFFARQSLGSNQHVNWERWSITTRGPVGTA